MQTDWHLIFNNSIVSSEKLEKEIPVNTDEVKQVIAKYPMFINPYFLSLIKNNPALLKQSVPDLLELEDCNHILDPLDEEYQSPVPNLIHRYPDRVVFLVSNKCAIYCRYCMRKRLMGQKNNITHESIKRGLDYIAKNSSIKDVILSGGDPLLLEDDKIEAILYKIRKIPHVDIIRIHTRIPCVLPQRIDFALAATIKKYHPIFVNIHFNHPDEITEESSQACSILADAGIPLGSQTVLLKGINDNTETMTLLMRKLIKNRVKPYYIHHCDPVKSVSHFRTSIQKGIEIMKNLRGFVSGMCVPYYMIDIPKGGGKIPILPEYIEDYENSLLKVRNFKGEIFEYPNTLS
ncbi:MAG: KamA family radical SAM protein [Desulfobacterales bacterium]|nr:KamA family radical SAM protein [Desulfobacterales bacterium]